MSSESARSRGLVAKNRSGNTSSPRLPDIIDASAAFQSDRPINAMSIDVEDYFHVSAFESRISRSSWAEMPSRVAQNVDRILSLLDEVDVKATFFVLGWVAENVPGVVARISAAGHEIGSHSYDHGRVSQTTREQFREDAVRVKGLLEDLAGTEVSGYRAPSFSITKRSIWAHDILQEAGYSYSSSVYPISHDHYGIPDAPRHPFRFTHGGLLELPLTTVRIADRNWPCAGGGYFRLLPLTYSRWAFTRVNRKENMPVVFYFHPWELDPGQPRVRGVSLKSRFRHYVNLKRFESRLSRILNEYAWGRLDTLVRDALLNQRNSHGQRGAN